MDPIRITHAARNYALDSENRIHGPEAARFGFKSGLVPGVGIYAAMTRAAVEAFGPEWIERGSASAKFLKPVYDGETIEVIGRPGPEAKPHSIEIEVRRDGELCAIGGASTNVGDAPAPLVSDFPRWALPGTDSRLAPSITILGPGTMLGSRELTLDLDLAARTFVREMGDPSPIYQASNALCHPAFLPAQANYIIRDNVALGPWIHVSSEIQHYASGLHNEPISLRGKIVEGWERKGHEFIKADLALFGRDDRPLARILHTAIVRLREEATAS